MLRLHASAHRDDVANHNEGFLEGVCHAIDVLRAIGRDDAADDVFARLFVPVQR